MKRKAYIFRILMCWLLPCIFASCEDDVVVSAGEEENGTSFDPRQPYYLAINLFDAGDDGYTRAAFDSDYEDEAGFNRGLDAEKALCPESDPMNGPHFILFFNNDGSLAGNMLYLSDVNWEEENYDGSTHSTTHSVLYVSVMGGDAQLSFTSGKILLVLNANADLAEKLKKVTKYSEAYGILAGDGTGSSTDYLFLDKDGKRYFTMSSSMVVSNGDVIPANLDRENNYLSSLGTELRWYNDRQQAIDNPACSFFVERLQAKYTLLFKKKDKLYYFDPENAEKDNESLTYHPTNKLIYTANDDFTPGDKYKKLRYVKEYIRSNSISDVAQIVVDEGDWKVNITGWSLNGIEKEEYLFKHLSTNTTYYSGWDGLLYRNFWAQDKNYNTGDYPDQYLAAYYLNSNNEVVKNTDIKGYGDITPTLTYKSYYTMRQEGKKPRQYTPENTFSQDLWTDKTDAYKSQAYLRAGTHVVVTAQLLIEGFDDAVYESDTVNENGFVRDDNNTPANSKYYMNGIYWMNMAYREYVGEYLAYWMLTDANKHIFGENDGIFYIGSNGVKATSNDFDVRDAEIKGGDGWVYIWPNKTLYTKNPETGSYTAITSEQFKMLIYQHPELMAQHFQSGRMYYPIAVEHNTNTNSSNTIATGDFGSVRNHWYYFTITDILSPGTPVDDSEQPIVPNNQPEENALGVNLRIMDWHTVSTDVDISGQRPPTGSN